MSLAETLAVMRAAFPLQDFPASSVQVYMRALADLPAEEVALAVENLIGRAEWMPSIAAIRREVAEVRLGLPNETAAWQMIQTPVGRMGAPPPVQAALAAVGGPWAVRSTESPERLRAQFRRAYAEIREGEIRQVAERRTGPEELLGSQPFGEIERATFEDSRVPERRP